MSGAGYFEVLRRKPREERLQKQVLLEIQQKKERLKRKIQSLQVQGDFHKAKLVEAKLEKLEKITARMIELLEAP